MQFIKATKEQAKLRLALFGPSGSGKTFTSLRIATGLGGNIALIDTERSSASMYADRFTFDVLELPKTDIATYVDGIAAASAYDVLIIDSLSHAWFDLLDEVEKLARAKYRGNTWSAWSEGTPKQRAMVNALLGFDGHIIVTMRVKTEWAIETLPKGKIKPVYVGLAPQQGKGIEYEFDLLVQLTQEHIATVLKDRTGKFQDQIIDKPGEDFGKSLAEWLTEGAVPKPKSEVIGKPKAIAESTDFDPANLTNFTKMTAAAVERLGYNHPAHVVNTLKKITGEDSDGLSYEDMWQMLSDHQPAKKEGGRTAEEAETVSKPEAAKATVRPLSPADLRRTIHEKAKTYVSYTDNENPPATARQIPFVARKFQEAFAPADDATHRYHLSLAWLWTDMEAMDSATKLTFGQASATLDWLLAKGGPDDSGDTPLHQHAPAEAAGVYREALTEQGQTDMFDNEEAIE